MYYVLYCISVIHISIHCDDIILMSLCALNSIVLKHMKHGFETSLNLDFFFFPAENLQGHLKILAEPCTCLFTIFRVSICNYLWNCPSPPHLEFKPSGGRSQIMSDLLMTSMPSLMLPARDEFDSLSQFMDVYKNRSHTLGQKETLSIAAPSIEAVQITRI